MMEYSPGPDRGTSIASVEDRSPLVHSGRCLTFLAEGTAMNVLELDAAMYQDFRSNVCKLAMEASDAMPEDEKLELVRALIQEFQRYRDSSNAVLRERVFRWRSLLRKAVGELLQGIVSEARSVAAARILQQLGMVATASELKKLEQDLEILLHPPATHPRPGDLSREAMNLSVANDNASGLPGGGSAMLRLKAMLQEGEDGFVAVIHLGCLEIIGDRFGTGAAQDCMMATAAYLIECLDSQDSVYHWTDASLMAILMGLASARVAQAELQRITTQHRNLTIRIGERNVMVRIPLDFQVAPVQRFCESDELSQISAAFTAASHEIAR